MSSNNLLIVGGTGFIGQHLVRKACQTGYNVFVLSSREHKEMFSSKNLTYLIADIRDYTLLKNVLSDKKINYVINLGGYIDHVDFLSGGYSVIDTHLNGVINLSRCLNWSDLKGFVQIGSSDEYGNLPAPQFENECERPISCYSFAKAAANHFLQMLYREKKIPVTMLRLFLVYGPGQNNQRFIPQIIQGCLKGEKFPASLGGQLRDFCYVEDIADGILKSLKCPGAFGQVINLASGIPLRIKDLIELIRTDIGKGDPQYGVIPYRDGENMKLYADISKAKQLLSWEPATPLSDGIQKTIKYYKRKLV
ncbi:MAG: NAD-dependent epimerase/dehydratase family protein [Desulfobacteraceae bacterium]|nr:NAD-dependent epimerase/dehydratase family protein [Desulfobacteraceae bacterium]